MRRLHAGFAETLARLLSGRATPSSARMEAAIGRVWERLESGIDDTSAIVASQPVAVRGGRISSMAFGIASLLWRSVRRLHRLRHRGPFANH